MFHLLFGAIAMAGFLALVFFSRKKKLGVTWWQWMITLAGFVFVLFVLEAVYSFITEGSPRGALVMGVLMGFVAVVWAVVLARFVFHKRT